MGAGHDRSSGVLAADSARRISIRAPAGPAAKAAVESGGHSTAETDVLSDALRAVRLTGALFFTVGSWSPWRNLIPAASRFGPIVLPRAQHVISYHIITHGTCWVVLPGDAGAVQLHAGDVIVVPHGHPYLMSSERGTFSTAGEDDSLEFFRQMVRSDAPSHVTDGGGSPPDAAVICGYLGCSDRPFNPILQALPPLLHLRRRAKDDPLDALIGFAMTESRERRAGTRNVLLRLSEILFVEVIRRHLDSLPEQERGWLAGLRDPVVCRALTLLHDRPAEAWTLELLAREAGVSRSVLAGRFTELIGQPPMRYLTLWRMQRAARLLEDGDAKVSAVALDVGYESEAAFSRAFKKSAGISPGAWRRAAGTAGSVDRSILPPVRGSR